MAPAEGELVERGDKTSNLPGTLTFIGLRALDPLLQYAILGRGFADKFVSHLGTSALNQGPTSNTGYAFLDSLELSPYRLILLSMAVGQSAKHIIWKLLIGEENVPASAAAQISIFNSVLNSFNSLLFISAATSVAYGRGEGPNWDGYPSLQLTVGAALFTVGITAELAAEFQRKAFKSNPANKGKPYTGGLFATARHINYGAYLVWRIGYALAAGGWTWAALNAAFVANQFISSSIPALDRYCTQRYADMWADYKRKTPYKLIPLIY